MEQETFRHTNTCTSETRKTYEWSRISGVQKWTTKGVFKKYTKWQVLAALDASNVSDETTEERTLRGPDSSENNRRCPALTLRALCKCWIPKFDLTSPYQQRIQDFQIFPKTAWKWRKFSREVQGAHPKFYHIDPPLHTVSHKESQIFFENLTIRHYVI